MSAASSYTAVWKERGWYENNLDLSVSGQGPKPGPMKNRADFPQAVHQLVALKQHVEKLIRTFQCIYDSDNVQLNKRQTWTVNGKVGVGTNVHRLPHLLQLGGRHKNGRERK